MMSTTWNRALIVGVIAMFLSVLPAQAVNLVTNGDFNGGWTGWVEDNYPMSHSTVSGYTTIVTEPGHGNVMKIDTTSGANYYRNVQQDIFVTQPADMFDVQYDWKITTKQSPYGVAGVYVSFWDAGDQLIGQVCTFDTANSAHTLNSFRGPLPVDAFYGERYWIETFDWQTVSVSTAQLPGMDATQVERIHINIGIQTDISSGAVLLTDNFTITSTASAVPEPATMLAGLAGLAGLGRYLHRRQ